MRVALHAGQLLQPVPGGIGRYVRRLATALPGAGVDVTSFGAGPRPGDLPDSVPWVDLGRPHGSWRYEAWHRLRRPRCGVAGEVLHAPSLAVPPPGARPLVVTVHDVAFLRRPQETTARGRAFHARGLAIARREAAMVVVPSAFTRRELLAEGFDPDAVAVVPHGADFPLPLAEGEIDARVAAAGVRAPFVLTVGTVEPRKGLRELAAAVDRARHAHPGLVLAVVGPGGWGTVDGIDGPGVARLGPLPWATVDALYRRAAVTCVASAYEGFGLPALEALARGCPLVVADAGALVELAGDAAIAVPAGDVGALGDAITRVLDDGALRADLAARGPARAAGFTWERSAQGHAAAYAAAVRRYAAGNRRGAP